jgi:hypothetical protein
LFIFDRPLIPSLLASLRSSSLVRSLPCAMRHPFPRRSITPTPYPGEFIPNGQQNEPNEAAL